MALNTLEKAVKYTAALDKVIVQKAVTGFMIDNGLKAQFMGADTVKIPSVDFVGLADYDRDEGFSKAGITVSRETYQLTQDRGRKMQIDTMDLDETGISNLSGTILGEYVRTQVVPEMDAYVLSKLYGVANQKGNVTTYNESTIIKDLLQSFNSVYDAVGYGDAELVAFVDPVVYGLIQTTNEITRQIVVSDFKQGDLNFKVKTLNGVAIIPVSSARMKSQYTFPEATKTTGGFTPTADAKDVRAIILPKSACHVVKKHETLRIFEPSQNQNADAYIFNYRLHYDAFVKKSELGTVRAIATA